MRERLVPVRVLIADDDQRVRVALGNLLSSAHGITVVGAAATADTALQIANDERPHVALVDLLFPDIDDGLGLLDTLTRELRIPAIAISIEGWLHDRAVAAGAFTFIEKGSDPERLVDAVHEAVGTGRALPR